MNVWQLRHSICMTGEKGLTVLIKMSAVVMLGGRRCRRVVQEVQRLCVCVCVLFLSGLVVWCYIKAHQKSKSSLLVGAYLTHSSSSLHSSPHPLLPHSLICPHSPSSSSPPLVRRAKLNRGKAFPAVSLHLWCKSWWRAPWGIIRESVPGSQRER